MSDFLLKKTNKNRKIIQISLPLNGVSMKPKLKHHKSLIAIKELILIEEDIKKNMILKQFDRTFRKLVAMMLDVTESEDTTSSDCAIALNEISKVSSMLERKYERDLQKKEIAKLQKKLLMLDAKIREKLLMIRTNEMLQNMVKTPEHIPEKGRGR